MREVTLLRPECMYCPVADKCGMTDDQDVCDRMLEEVVREGYIEYREVWNVYADEYGDS